jgi:phosphatidylethanolamine/phosphatidyl-N-methylethanolamine N-methyltransferase
MNHNETLRAYRGYAPTYDVLFGPLFYPGRRSALALVNDRPHQRVLEVGVGTGLSLPHFRCDARVTGIDVSPEMLEKARRRAQRLGLAERVELREMDAQAMEFSDNSFDAILGLYVASCVPDPKRFGAEIRRVCVPGGRIVICNHFTSDQPILRRLEQGLRPLAGRLGFEPDFPLDRFISASGLTIRSIEPSNLFGYWKLLRCVNEKG